MLRCGFYEKEITPPLGSSIPGYFNLRQGSDVKDRLFARALVVDNGKAKAAAISVDSCGLDEAFITGVTARITEYTGITADKVMVCSTHTHTGLPRPTEHKYDDVESVVKARDGYLAVLTNLLADCVTLADKRLTDSAVFFGKGEVHGISFCRDYYMKNTTPTTNPPRTSPEIVGPVAETDDELPVMFVRDGAGNPMGAVVNFACHPDCVSGAEYTGDYISEMSKQLKKVYGPDFVTLFMLGACGDINHFDVSKPSDAPDHFRMMGQKLAGEVVKVVANAAPVTDDTVTAKREFIKLGRAELSEEKIAAARHCIATVKEIPGIKIAADATDPDQYNLAMSKSLVDFIDNTPETMELPLHFMQIGDIKFYTYPGEIFCCYGLQLKEKADTEKAVVVTLCDGTNGYVPALDRFYDTIYESRPGANKLERAAGNKMTEKLLEMAK